MARMRSVAAILAVALITTLFLAVPVASAMIPGYYGQMIAQGMNAYDRLAISGDRLVWQALDSNGHDQIWTWKRGVDTLPSQVTTDMTSHYGPVVSGDRIAWFQLTDTGTPMGSRYLVRTIKWGVDAESSLVTTNPYDCSGLSVSGDRIAFRQSAGTSFQAYTRKMGVDARVSNVTSNLLSGDANSIALSGDRLVWLEDVGGVAQVFTWKRGGSTIQLTSNVHDHYLPQVSGDRVVWMERDDTFNLQVWTRKMGVDSVAKRLTNTATGKDDASVSGDLVVWWDSPAPGLVSRVMAMKVGSAASAVTPAIPELSAPLVSGSRIVWRNFEDGGYNLYSRKIGTDATSTQIGSNDDMGTPVLSGDRIAWMQDGGGTTQIIFLKAITTPKITRSPSASTLNLKRKSGKVSKTLAATIQDADGTLLAGVTVVLQVSSNGKTGWTNVSGGSLRTSTAGKVSKALTWTKRVTRYYRWRFAAVPGFNAATSSRCKVVVK